MRRARAGKKSKQAPPPWTGGGGATLSVLFKVFSSNGQDIPLFDSLAFVQSKHF
jgi:hypothetical protein